MNKLLKITAGTMMAAALMVGCNMNEEEQGGNESLINDAIDGTENAIDNGEDAVDNNLDEDAIDNNLNDNEGLMRDDKSNNGDDDPFNDENNRLDREDKNNIAE